MQFVIVTTINPPTEIFSKLIGKGMNCVVIGDDKTPKDWSSPGVEFLNIDMQNTLGYSITKYLPHSHYSRKNIGYVYAKINGATGIIDTDDDNYPTDNWQYPVISNDSQTTLENQGFLNVYEHFSNEFCWARGFPLDEIIPSKGKIKLCIANNKLDSTKVGIWQGLVNGDPDFDAIYRLTHEFHDHNFNEINPLILTNGCYCPINSQNTYFIDELFPLLYLPISVAFRFTDILRGYIAEVLSFQNGYSVGYCSPNVVQIRNKHNLFRDFQDELTTYQFSKRVVEIAEAEVSNGNSLSSNLHKIYSALAKNNIVAFSELSSLDAFLTDIT